DLAFRLHRLVVIGQIGFTHHRILTLIYRLSNQSMQQPPLTAVKAKTRKKELDRAEAAPKLDCQVDSCVGRFQDCSLFRWLLERQFDLFDLSTRTGFSRIG